MSDRSPQLSMVDTKKTKVEAKSEDDSATVNVDGLVSEHMETKRKPDSTDDESTPSKKLKKSPHVENPLSSEHTSDDEKPDFSDGTFIKKNGPPKGNDHRGPPLPSSSDDESEEETSDQEEERHEGEYRDLMHKIECLSDGSLDSEEVDERAYAFQYDKLWRGTCLNDLSDSD